MALLACVATVSCTHERPSTGIGVANHLQARRIIDIAFDTVFATAFSQQDTVLLDPGFMEVDRTGVLVYDGPRGTLIKLGPSGQLAWTLGRTGGGPAEFRGVRDIERVGDGTIAVLDPGLARITILTPDGRVKRMVDISRAGHAEQLVPLPGDRFLLGRLSSDAPFTVIDSSGVVVDSVQAPWAGFASLNPMASQYYLSASPGSGRWVAGLALGSVFWIMDGLAARVPSASYIEWIDAPEPTVSKRGEEIVTRVPNAPTAVDLVLSDSALFILFRGESEFAGRVVDVYDPNTGRYRHSFLLPASSTELAYDHGTFYIMTWKPTANIIGLHPKSH